MYCVKPTFIAAVSLLLTIQLNTFSFVYACEEQEESTVFNRNTPQVVEAEDDITENEPYSSSSSTLQMPFRLGFEFQEISGLCPWALDNYNLQRKPLFFIKDSNFNRSLWHAVIDTSDIEFVANHFSYKEASILENCLDTILTSFNILHELLQEHKSITFRNWTDAIKLILDPPFSICITDLYLKVEDQLIISPNNEWIPQFAPQATIQHPLEYAIPLYFGLFGFDSRQMPFFTASLPCRDEFLEAQKAADSEIFAQRVAAYQGKMNGLVFLHALTLVQMAPSEDYLDGEDPEKISNLDEEALQRTYENLTSSQQVDAKMQLTLMSRRPFSQMFDEIHSRGSYATYFTEAMKLNAGFFKVPYLLAKVNYGEQFFAPDTGAPKPLEGFLPLFQEDFLAKNEEIIKKLLQQGVITTTMLRNFKEDVIINNRPLKDLLENFYIFALNSIDYPIPRLIIDTNEIGVKIISSEEDLLSPPWFLDASNSMGEYKKGLSEEQMQYGEAIIEVRAIPNVQSWFLKKCGLSDDIKGKFLRTPGPELKTQAIKLFNFLYSFGTPTHTMEIFYLGIPHALRSH
jgi:hypothetical protein